MKKMPSFKLANKVIFPATSAHGKDRKSSYSEKEGDKGDTFKEADKSLEAAKERLRSQLRTEYDLYGYLLARLDRQVRKIKSGKVLMDS